MNKVYLLAGLAMIVVLSGCVRDMNRSFLNAGQKLQLIDHGYIVNEAGEGYDIFICPGYGPVLEYGRDNLREGAGDLARYGKGKRWKEMFDKSHDALKTGYKDCIGEFMIEDGLKTWRDNFGHAHQQATARTFGWWLAYPWAFSTSLLDNAGRTLLGSIGAGACFAGGIVVVPAAYAVEPAVSAGWNAGVEGVGVTALGLGWNTAVTPLLSMTERVPAPNHVDGFWIRNVGPDVNRTLNPRSREQMQDLVDWGKVLLAEVEKNREAPESRDGSPPPQTELAGQIGAIDEEIDALQREIGRLKNTMDDLQQRKAGLETRLEEIARQCKSTEIEMAKTLFTAPPEEHRQLVEKVRQGQWDGKTMALYTSDIQYLLNHDEALDEDQALIILRLLQDSAPDQRADSGAEEQKAE